VRLSLVKTGITFTDTNARTGIRVKQAINAMRRGLEVSDSTGAIIGVSLFGLP
jgi:hypothetical protein